LATYGSPIEATLLNLGWGSMTEGTVLGEVGENGYGSQKQLLTKDNSSDVDVIAGV